MVYSSAIYRVTLNDGECHFHVLAGPLMERSGYFKELISRGSYSAYAGGCNSISVIFTDVVIFGVIVQYIDNGIFPLYYKDRSHDYKMYERLLAAALKLKCRALVAWLEDECYHKCVSTSTTMRPITPGENGTPPVPVISAGGNVVETSVIKGDVVKRDIYLCPRGVKGHSGNLKVCIEDQQCRKAQGTTFKCEVEEVTAWFLVEKEIKYHRSWMLEEG